MGSDKEKQLEELIHRELRSLPDVPAPATLVHRVMLAVHANANQRWWRRPWLSWPFGVQLVSLAVLLGCAGLVSYLLGAAWDGLQVKPIWQRVAESFAWLKPVREIVAALGSALLLLARAVNQQAVLIGVAVLGLAYLALVGLGTVCVRLAFNKA